MKSARQKATEQECAALREQVRELGEWFKKAAQELHQRTTHSREALRNEENTP